MNQKQPSSRLRRGQAGFRSLLADLRRDQKEQRRLLAGLERHAREQRSPPLDEVHRQVHQMGCQLARLAALARDALADALADADDNAIVNPAVLQHLRRGRRWRRQLIRNLPDLVAGIPIESEEADAAKVAQAEQKPLPGTPDVESALLQLPTPWLSAVNGQYGSGPRMNRARLAASVAGFVYEPSCVAGVFDRFLDVDHLTLLARIVGAGRLPEQDLSPEERDEFRMGLDWRPTATGRGARLRQLGLVFVGLHEGRRTVYVPEEARSPLALELLKLVRAPDASDMAVDRALAADLERLSQPAKARAAREEAALAALPVYRNRLPSRAGRIRRRTPGPDRVYEIQVVARRAMVDDGPCVRRRILISYQRSLGALSEVIRVAVGHRGGIDGTFLSTTDEGEQTIWVDPAAHLRLGHRRDEWTTSVRDALARPHSTLTYMTGGGWVYGHDLHLLQVHAPEHVEAEPRVVWGEGIVENGVEDWPQDLPAALDAANVFLERFD